MINKVRLLHSFPNDEDKFKNYCKLTFKSKKYDNFFIDHLGALNPINDEFDIIFVHKLRPEDIDWLLQNKDLRTPKVWFFWGADFFGQGKFYNKFVLNKTRKIRIKLLLKDPLQKSAKQVVKSIFPFAIDFTKRTKRKISAINSFDFIVPIMPGDYELIVESYDIKPKLFHLNYVNPSVLKQVNYTTTSGNNILLGNSASFTNNHVEAIDQLEQYDLDDRKVIVPLSYGNDKLAKYVSEYAVNKLGNRKVKILREFIPFSKYNEIVNSCEIVIMNHLRQQAVGNIVQALLSGSHVYLRSESTVYKYLKDNGIIVTAFDKINSLGSLTVGEIKSNCNRTKEIFGAEKQHQKLKELILKLIDY